MDGIGKWMLHAAAGWTCARMRCRNAMRSRSVKGIRRGASRCRRAIRTRTWIATPAFKPGKPDFTSREELQAFASMSSRRSPDLRFASSEPRRKLGDSAARFARPSPGDGGDLAKAGKPTVLIISQQHGNEPAGGEAALALAAELADATQGKHLDQINVLIVPAQIPTGPSISFAV
jgi:hypothetical protein